MSDNTPLNQNKYTKPSHQVNIYIKLLIYTLKQIIQQNNRAQ
jgi:hypothetical protein